MTFEYRNQPYKSLYLVYSALFILLWWLPYWTLISIIPSWRPRPTWGILRTIYINALRKFIEVLWAVGHGIAESLPSSEGLVKIEALPRGLLVGELKELAERNEVGNEVTSGYWYQRKDRVGKIDESANPEEKIVYHIHGGGFVVGSASPTDLSTPVYCSGLLQYTSAISRILCIDYRISSASPFSTMNPFPAPVLDVLAGYHYLLHNLKLKPENIIISGDSAGCALALATVRYLLALDSKELPKPGGLLLSSPACDWDPRVPSSSAKISESFYRNALSDYGAPFYYGYPTHAILGHLSLPEIRKWISPASQQLEIEKPVGLFKGYPKAMIVGGEAEAMLDSIHLLRDRMVEDMGDKVKYLEVYGGTHSLLNMELFEPERGEAWRAIGQWIQMLP